MASNAFSLFERDLLSRLSPGRTLAQVFGLAADPDSPVAALAAALESNAAYGHLLRKLDILKDRDESLEHVVGLLGRQGTRNAVAAIRMTRAALAGAGLPRKKEDKMLLKPRERLKFALLAEDYCMEHRLPYADNAWAAGLHYDWLAAALEAIGQKNSLPALDVEWKASLRAARIAHGLGAHMKRFELDSHAFAGPLLIGVGRALMGVLYPKGGKLAWSDLADGMSKIRFNAMELERLRERGGLELTHSEVASLVVSQLGLLSRIERAVAHYQEPYLLGQGVPHLRALAVVMHLAVAAASKRPLDKLRRGWLTRELGVSDKDFAGIVAASEKGS